MLEIHHYELLAKYSTEEVEFNAAELTLLFNILNLKTEPFDAARLRKYLESICRAMHEQDKIMTEVGGEFLNRAKRDSKLAVLNYLVENISRIKSPYMLSILLDLVCVRTSGARGASRLRRHR